MKMPKFTAGKTIKQHFSHLIKSDKNNPCRKNDLSYTCIQKTARLESR